MQDQSMAQESLHDQFVAKEITHGQPMSKENIRSGNAMMIEHILQMPVQLYQDNKASYRVAEIRGRQSGQMRRTPLAVFQHKGERYLIAPTRKRDWVYNLIASGECVLLSKIEQESVHTTLTLDNEALNALRAYMAQLPDWSLQQFPMLGDATDEEMRSKAESFAVFRLSTIRDATAYSSSTTVA